MEIENIIRQIVDEEIKRVLAEIEKAKPRVGRNIVSGDKELRETLGISQTTLTRMNHRGDLDKARIKIGRRRNGYDLDKVMELLNINQ